MLFQVWLTELLSVTSFSRRQTHRESFITTPLLLTEKKKRFCVHRQCRFMEGPIVGEWQWENRAKQLLPLSWGVERRNPTRRNFLVQAESEQGKSCGCLKLRWRIYHEGWWETLLLLIHYFLWTFDMLSNTAEEHSPFSLIEYNPLIFFFFFLGLDLLP